jgi:intracellular septation protein
MKSMTGQIFAIVRSKLFIKLLLEFLPLGLFLIATDVYDIYVGSAVLGVATLISMALVWLVYRQLALMAIITGLTGLFAAGATVILVDPIWVKMKPTIVSFVFGTILAAGLAVNKPLLRPLIGADLNLTEEGWRTITWRWMAYFLFIAVLNEAVWRGANAANPTPHLPGVPHPADQIWATFKVIFLMPATIIYAAIQLPLLKRYRADPDLPMGGGDNLSSKEVLIPAVRTAGPEDGRLGVSEKPPYTKSPMPGTVFASGKADRSGGRLGHRAE